MESATLLMIVSKGWGGVGKGGKWPVVTRFLASTIILQSHMATACAGIDNIHALKLV